MSFGLGKGFDSLIPTDLIDEEFDPTATEDESLSSLHDIELSKIAPDSEQPRKEFDKEALQALADSIKEHGVLQPIVVVKEEDGYKIIAGERRFRASKLAGLKKIPAIVRTADAQNRLEISVIENAQRADLNPIELATAYAKLKSQFNLTTKEIANRIGKSEASIVNTTRLLNLSDEAKKAMLENNLSEGVMRPLVSADEALVKEILPKIIAEGWTSRKVERYIAEHKKKSSAKAVKVNNYIKQEESLSKKYGAKVRVSGRTLRLTCKNEKELEALLKKLA